MSSSTKPTTGIEDLPVEMISELFVHLPPKDLIVCSMVNKRWNSIYTAFKLHNLFVDDEREIMKWYTTKQTVEERFLCRPTMFRYLAEKPLLSNLKHLAIYKYNFEFDFDKLNRFQQLVHLEIHIPTLYNRKKVCLNLPRLKVLVFYDWNKGYSLLIDCPQLSTLLYPVEKYDTNLLEVKHPETIRKLETRLVDPNLTKFKNVVCLVTREFRAISKTTLLSLPRLRELHFNENIEHLVRYEFGREIGRIDRMKRMLSEFMDEAKQLRGGDFRFRFAGLQLSNVNVDQIDFGVQVCEETGEEIVFNECVYMKNYHLIERDALHFVKIVNYTRLLRHVTGEFPRCFSQKFTGIQYVEVDGEVQDADQFLWFLKSLRFLRTLVLKRTGLGLEFYDQLPASAQSLSELHLRDGHCENELNFDFLGKLSRLTCLTVYPALSLDSVHLLVRWLGPLEAGEFGVQTKDCYFSVLKYGSEWTIEGDPDNEVLFKSENPEEIGKFFKAFQDKQ